MDYYRPEVIIIIRTKEPRDPPLIEEGVKTDFTGIELG